MFASLNNACRRAAQLFITILTILIIGKLITLVPVMHQLELANTFKAAEMIWFLARLSALLVFYFFTRYLIDAIPSNGGALSFVKGIAEPLAALLIVIAVQALFWELLTPFVNAIGRTVYHSSAIILIVCASVWLVLRAYRYSAYLVDTVNNLSETLSRLIPQQKQVCAQCHTEIAAKAHFCSQCGHKTREPRCCTECGEAILEGQKYCQNCGTTLGKATGSNE